MGWGATTRIDKGNKVEVQIGGRWKKLSSLKGWKNDTYQELLEGYDDLFTNSMIAQMMKSLKINRVQLFKILGVGRIAASPAGREIPDKWMLNDFGHKSIKYFTDGNDNGVVDKGEKLSAEFIHSSPDTEVWANLGLLARTKIKDKALSRRPWAGTEDEHYIFLERKILGYSHGCIHVFPNDIDEMINKGYLIKGSLVEVHSYGDKLEKVLRVKRSRTLKYEVHFYPTEYKVAVYQT